MATSHAPHDAGSDPRRLVPLAVWSALGLIAVVLLSRSAAGAFTRPLPQIVPCLLGVTALALSLWAWWWDDRAHGNATPVDRSVRGLAALVAPLVIGMTTSAGASSAIGILLGLGLLSAAAVLAVSWEVAPWLALRSPPQQAVPTPHVETSLRAEDIEPPVAWEPALRSEPEAASRFADPGVSQQVTRRITPDDLDCIEALLRVTFAAGEREAVIHLPIHPPLPAVPEVECEPLEDDDVTFKVTTAQPYGVRIEVRRNGEYDEVCTFAVGVALHARKAAEDAA